MAAAYSDMRDKVALVTGIGQARQTQSQDLWGNGAATARLLAQNGVKIAGCDINLEDAAWIKTRILSRIPDALIDVFKADVTKLAEVRSLVKMVVGKYGRIDYLVNNVGISRPGGPVELSEEAFDQQLKVNLTSTFLCCKEVVPVMENQGSGSIIVTSSIAGLGYIGKVHIGYATTKAALLNFTKCVAVQYAPKGIRINAVVPGLIATPLVERLANEYHKGDYEGLMKKRGKGVPLGRQGTSEDVANATVFLLSEAASYITGTSLTVDGGTTAVVYVFGKCKQSIFINIVGAVPAAVTMSYLFRTDFNGTAHEAEPTFGIPKECKAGVVVNEGPDFRIEVQMVPVPEPGPDEILIKLNATGICFSDLHFCMGDLGTPPMSAFGVRSPGHEGVGVVVKVGSNVKNWKVNERAGMKPRWSVCGDCDLCLNDKESYCRKSVLCGLHKAGTYQQYVTSPAHYTQRIPDGVDDYSAAPIMCSAGTMYRALRLANLKFNNWVVFPGGGGGVGIQGVQLAAAMGLRPIVVDTGAEKRNLALLRGAVAFIDFKRDSDTVAEVIKVADGIGAHGVFVTAGSSYSSAIPYVGTRVGATVTCIGLPHKSDIVISAPPTKFITQELTVRGSIVGGRADIAIALEYAAAGKLSGDHTIYSIEDLPVAVEKIRRGESVGRGVVDFNL